MKKQSNEFKRMQKLAGLLNESTYVNSKGDISDTDDFAVYIEDGDIEDYEEGGSIEGISVQVVYYDTTQEEYTDIGFHPDPKKYVSSGDLEEYMVQLGATIWTKDPLEIYKGNGDWDPLGHKTYEYQFETFEELENFMENDLKETLRTIYNLK